MSGKLGDKIGAKHLCFMLDNKQLHCAWYSLIEFEGRMMHIKDESALMGIVEAETRYLAKKKAKEFLEKMKEKN
ncbi:hypothetical protein ACFQZE_06520 [Paenibacillus sp. GCM10027627]|uniref:hypothetical protein n=1 Tax=unclassified Paenibacillus TaxID=185978 RepID=UPI00363A268E